MPLRISCVCVCVCAFISFQIYLGNNDVFVRAAVPAKLAWEEKGRQCENMLRSQSLRDYSRRRRRRRLASHSLPTKKQRDNGTGNLFDPYHAQKQMSWNATDTACEWEMTGRA